MVSPFTLYYFSFSLIDWWVTNPYNFLSKHSVAINKTSANSTANNWESNTIYRTCSYSYLIHRTEVKWCKGMYFAYITMVFSCLVTLILDNQVIFLSFVNWLSNSWSRFKRVKIRIDYPGRFSTICAEWTPHGGLKRDKLSLLMSILKGLSHSAPLTLSQLEGWLPFGL